MHLKHKGHVTEAKSAISGFNKDIRVRSPACQINIQFLYIWICKLLLLEIW